MEQALTFGPKDVILTGAASQTEVCGRKLMDLDIGEELGADGGYSSQRLTIFIPNKDKDGVVLANVDQWVHEARELLSQIGGGATTYPPADGNWLDENGENLWEQTRIVYFYIYPDRFHANLHRLRNFLHRFGSETNQGEVVIEFDNRFWRIHKYAPNSGD
jgi:hypothetical protein